LHVEVTGLTSLLDQTVSQTVGAFTVHYYSNHSYSFAADGTSATLSFTDVTTNNGTNFDTLLDGVAVSESSVPIPGSALLMLFGLTALRRDKRR